MRKIVLVLLLLFCWTSLCAAAPMEEALAIELCQAQSWENMRAGVFMIPENILNEYFSGAVREHPQVKEAKITVLEHNRLRLLVHSEGNPPLQLTCTIKEFHYDKERASLELQIDKKEIIGRPVTSWLMNQVSWGFISDIFGNPLDKANVQSKVRGNRLSIDLKPFMAGLFQHGIGARIGELLVISQATTETGIICLHTNFAMGMLTPGI